MASDRVAGHYGAPTRKHRVEAASGDDSGTAGGTTLRCTVRMAVNAVYVGPEAG